MDLFKINNEDKVKAFNMIIDAYNKDTNLSTFGKEVEEIIDFLRKMNKFKGQ